MQHSAADNSAAECCIHLLTGECNRSGAVGVDEVDPGATTAGEGREDGPEGGRRTTTATDHATEVLGVDPDLEQRAAAQLLLADDDLVGVVDHAAHQVLQRLGEHQDSLLPASSAAPESD